MIHSPCFNYVCSSFPLIVFAVTLALRYICFKYLDRVKRAIFQASDIAKRLSINVLVIL